MKFTFLALIMLSLLQVQCQKVRSQRSQPSAEADWNKRFWFDKAKRTMLLGSKALSPEEEARLLALPRAEIVDELMKKPEFYNSVLDFNLYFLGRRLEKIVDQKGLLEASSSSSSAVNSAVEMAAGRDYFTLFKWSQSFTSIQDLDFERIEKAGVPQELRLQSPGAYRLYWIEQALGDVRRMREAALKGRDARQACDLLADQDREDFYGFSLYRAALPSNLLKLFAINFKVSSRCGLLGINFPMTPELREQLLRELAALEQNLQRLPALIAQLPSARAKSVADLYRVNFNDLAPETTVFDQAFDDKLWREIPNFSTNYNRRRAAYVLKTYFCDDLTPINIVAPSVHSENRHASDSACASCHYKLDPMAGFFRSRGVEGTDFSDQLDFSVLVHDDSALREGEEVQSYLDAWRNPEGSARPWNVGYIRSTSKDSLNSYGESMDDLFRIIYQARESKVCLTRRLAEYVLGADQTYDGAWIDALAQELHQATAAEAAPDASSVAFKKVYKTFVLSQTFSQADAEPGQCYDFAPGATPSKLPCAVASIIQKNCTSCHRGEGAAGGLDLSSWQDAEGGRFAHRDRETGAQLAKAASFERISSRISSADPTKQMPLMRAMDAVERASLYKWLTFELAGAPR